MHEGEGLDDPTARAAVPGSLDTTAVLGPTQGSAPPSRWTRWTAPVSAAADRTTSGPLDALVNNAVHTGPGSMTRFEDTTLD